MSYLYIYTKKKRVLCYNGNARCKGEFFGEGFGERLSHCGGRGGVSGRCCRLRGDCGSGFVSVSVGTGTASGWESRTPAANSGPTSDPRDPSRVRPPLPPPSFSSVVVRGEGPMTSLTMLPRSTAWDGDVSGSVSCEAADGGGHTLSWKMEPDSDARGRKRRGGDDGTGEVESTGGEKSGCQYVYGWEDGMLPLPLPPLGPRDRALRVTKGSSLSV